MRTRAAMIRQAGQPWEVTILELDDPGPGEVLIKFFASGLCHSDEHVRAGHTEARLPMVGGHEGAGVVEAIGEDVTRVKPGDHVVCSFIPACGACRYCSTGRQNLTLPRSPLHTKRTRAGASGGGAVTNSPSAVTPLLCTR